MNCGPSVFKRVKQFQRFTHERQGYRSVSNRLWHDFPIYASEARSDTQATELFASEWTTTEFKLALRIPRECSATHAVPIEATSHRQLSLLDVSDRSKNRRVEVVESIALGQTPRQVGIR